MSPTTAPPTTDELHHLWRTRPVRSGGDAMVAGVCSGIARRYRVDPTLVRVALVVAALFGGSGVLAYIAGMVVLPSDGVDRPRRRGRPGRVGGPHGGWKHGGMGREMHRPGPVVVVIAVVVLLAVLPSPAWGSSGLVGAVLLLVGLWALHRRTPEPPEGTSAEAPVSLTKPTVDPVTTPADPSAPEDDPTVRITPPAWDPLGAAPFAWDLPEPSAPSPTPARTRRDTAVVAVVVGIALVVAAIGTALRAVGLDGVTPVRIVAATLCVVAIGVVVGAIRGRRTGLAGIAALLAAVVVILGVAQSSPGLPGGGVGERVWTPTSENDIAERYSLTVGSAELDLRSVSLSANRSVTMSVGVGQVIVRAPENMNIRMTCHTTVGDHTCPAGISGGGDGTAGPVVDVDATVTAGEIAVRRG
ncbi:PspC domain-containing protein [Williamsia deligens]|uniref:PspC domain-containing protein n=1 Tax=Williamsia deligens TaxID=321325 RepID=A0ABW3GE49_9NOCA|nr:PspC domain-containing protein [Williamsia deligens]MCP2192363.1 phage shock protein C (PspC) family protein [Williamsia deligens]